MSVCVEIYHRCSSIDLLIQLIFHESGDRSCCLVSYGNTLNNSGFSHEVMNQFFIRYGNHHRWKECVTTTVSSVSGAQLCLLLKDMCDADSKCVCVRVRA